MRRGFGPPRPQTFKVISISQPRTLFKCAPPFPSFPRTIIPPPRSDDGSTHPWN
uniref:Uncharacterized protein n=1 Tax=Oryza punctata TaxID=4537 RepID=A0A0E0LG33_ORYPU